MHVGDQVGGGVSTKLSAFVYGFCGIHADWKIEYLPTDHLLATVRGCRLMTQVPQSRSLRSGVVPVVGKRAVAFGEWADAEIFTHERAHLGGRFAACLPAGSILWTADSRAVDVAVADASQTVEHAVGCLDDGLGRDEPHPF